MARQRSQRAGHDQVMDRDGYRAGGPVEVTQPPFGRLVMPQRFQVFLVEEGVEVFRRVVPKVDVGHDAINLVREAAAAAVKVVLPLWHSRHGVAWGGGAA